MYKKIEDALQDPQFGNCKIMLHLDINIFQTLEFKGATEEQAQVLESDVDFIPTRQYPRGCFAEQYEIGHDFHFRYYLLEKEVQQT